MLPRSDIARPVFPEYLKAGGMHMRRVDDAFAARIWKGDTLLGWAGDDRLALYVAPVDGRWCLVRSCEDRTFQVLTTRDAKVVNTADIVGNLVGFCLATDARRVDVFADMRAANRRVSDEVDRNLERWVEEEGAPRKTRQLMQAADRHVAPLTVPG